MHKLLLFILWAIASTSMAQVDISNYDQFTDEERVEFLWAQFLDDQLDPIKLYSTLKDIEVDTLNFSSKLRIIKLESLFSEAKKDVVITVPDLLTKQDILRIAAEIEFYGHILGETSSENKIKIQKAQAELAKLKKFEEKSATELNDLFFNTSDYASYQNGAYKDTLKLFLICRHNRNYACLFVMKDIFDNPVRNDDGTLWSIPALAKSTRNFPYNITNGQTPQGVHRMDSVMPEANSPLDFGKWRRVILNWIEGDDFNSDMYHFLPAQTLEKNWWKQASVARDVGRKWLRIHGTGRINKNPSATYYPHVPTGGCISTREGQYEQVDFQDQRLLLDKMMQSMQLFPVYENEVSIKGILYVVDLDTKSKNVTLEDLKEYGIE